MGRACLFQLLHKVAGMVGKVLDLFTDSSIQQIAVGVGNAAKLPAAALLQLAHIGKNYPPFCRFAPGDLGVHPAATGAPQQTGQQRLVAPGCVVGLGSVPLQRFLHPDPPIGGNDAGVFAHRNDPLADGIVDGGTPLFLIAAVVGKHAPHTVKIGLRGEQLCFVVHKILIGVLVCNQIDGILQNRLDGKTGERTPGFCFDALPQQLGLGHGQGIILLVEVEDFVDDLCLIRQQLQLAGFLGLAVHRDDLDALGGVSRGGGAAQPASGLCQLVHIIPDALCNSLPLQLAEHRCDVHHGTSHGAGGIKAFPDGHKVDVQPSKLFNQAGKIADVAADAVQTIDHDGTDLPLFGGGHHLFEVWAVQVAAGKALVLKDDSLLCCGIAAVGADIFAAEVDLISDTFALAGVAGLAGINCNGVGSFGHEILLLLSGGRRCGYCSMTSHLGKEK